MKYVLLIPLLVVCAWAQSGPGKEIGSGAGDIGKGAAKGAAVAGKDVGVGTVKGTAKIGKGIGKAVKKLF